MNREDMPFSALLQIDSQNELTPVIDDDGALALSGKQVIDAVRREALQSLKSGSLVVGHDPLVLAANGGKSSQGAAVEEYVLAPIIGQHPKHAFVLLAGISPHLPLDMNYQAFFNNVARELSAAIRETRALEEERQRAQALLELDRAKTVFFNNISHEFRTPLTLMLGPLESMLSSPDGSASEEERQKNIELQTMHRSVLRLLKLVNTLLDFSRIEAGRYDADFVATNVSEFTNDLASLFRSAIEKAGLKYQVDCEPCLTPAYIDRDMWEKIVLNLVSNAFKFTTQGSIKVAMRETKDNFQLSVTDTGIGIDKSELDKIFLRFHRSKAEGARTHEGSGIGLSMVHELVRLHGGTVEVKSQFGQGSQFVVAVPKGHRHLPNEHVTHAAPTPEIKHAQAFVQEASDWLRGVSDLQQEPGLVQHQTDQWILVVDDNADMREYLLRLLNPMWTVKLAADGLEALGIIEETPPDLLIADIMMPRLDGLGLVQRLREREDTRNLPVLLLSAKAGEEARAEGIESGASDYLVKPFSARELYARAARLLEQRSIEQTLEKAVRNRTEQLEAALEVKSRFLSTVSHEVRTPMAGVIGLVELLHLSAEGEFKTIASTALDACKRLLQILNDLLDASRLQAGAMKIERRLFAIRPVVGDVIQLIAPEALHKMVEVSSTVEADVPDFVCGDELRVRQILQNLAFNAIKFTSKGSVCLHVEFVEHDSLGASLKFTVQDTGIGIAPAQQEKIFEAFAQAEDSTTRVFGGTGLGLNICRTLTDLMGGKIGVDSEAGQGSTFWVIIPVRDDLCRAE
jgi:signal transduction histidine kinase